MVKKQTPSNEVDQKALVNEKAKKAQTEENEHVRRVTLNGADGQ